MDNRGIIYVAVGEKYTRDAEKSISSLRSFLPDIPVTVYSDHDLIVKDPNLTSIIIPSNVPHRIIKNQCLQNSKYSKTLYLDDDTYVCESFVEIFEILDRFDLALALCPNQDTTPSQLIPTFPNYNAGAILYRHSETTQKFFSSWLNNYNENFTVEKLDEPSLRKTLLESQELNFTTLLPEYNCQLDHPLILSRKVKILHGEPDQVEKAKTTINNFTGYRLYHPKTGVTSKL